MQTSNNNLNTFRILFLVKGILTLAFSLFFLFYALIGNFVSNMDEIMQRPDAPPFNPGIIFTIIGVTGFFITIILGTLTVLTAKYINELRNYNFVFVVAILNCFTGILGILLCIFTLIEISKPQVKELFGKSY